MAKNYAITRIEKYSHVSQASYLLNHHLRLVEVANADPEKKNKNTVVVQKNVMEFLNDTPAGSKKNACRFVDVLFTASRFEDKKQADEWEKATIAFAKKEFGAENIALMVTHNDERTKHMHVIFKPVNPKTKKLGAGHWFDGRMKMKAYQERYFKAVEHLDFDRGDPLKRAHHTTLKEHYAQVNKSASEAKKQVEEFQEALKDLREETKNITLMDMVRPVRFVDRLKPKFQKVFKKGKEILKHQAFNELEQKEQNTQKLAEENQNLKDKLLAMTGKENPNWVEVDKYSEALTAIAEEQAKPSTHAPATKPKIAPGQIHQPTKKPKI